MDRERITISIKKPLLKIIDKTVDGTEIRNRSHAVETLVNQMLNSVDNKLAVILLGGEDALKSIPAVQAVLENLSACGFNEIYIAVGFLADKIKEKLGDGKKFGLNFKYITGGEGSGGALLPLKKVLDKTFLVVNISTDISLDISKLLEYHKKYNPIATAATNDLSEFKGIYIFDPKIFNFIPKGFSMLETDILPELAEKDKLIVKPII